MAVHDDEPEEAASTASKTSIRPILMASFAIILGFFPLAGSEMRQLLGTPCASACLESLFGLPLTAAFYVIVCYMSVKPASLLWVHP